MISNPARLDWPTPHCAEFAAEHVKQVTGRDVWAELGGCPRTPREAAALYRKLGTPGFGETVTAVLGEPLDPKQAMRGDIALIASPGGLQALGIVRGEWVECVDNMIPIWRASCVWRVGGPRA